jgi:hypothetical protein
MSKSFATASNGVRRTKTIERSSTPSTPGPGEAGDSDTPSRSHTIACRFTPVPAKCAA